MIKQLENYYLAINNAELALSRGVDRAENAEHAANKKIHDMTAAARLDISSREERIKQLERWISSAQTSRTEAHLPEPTETINGIDGFGPFQNSLEKIVHLREELATQEKVEKGLESENHASKLASIVGLSGIIFAILTLLLGNTMLVWIILPAYAVGVFVSARRYWKNADPAAGAFTLSRIQRGEKVGLPMLPTALFMFSFSVLGVLLLVSPAESLIVSPMQSLTENTVPTFQNPEDYKNATSLGAGSLVFSMFALWAAGVYQWMIFRDDDADYGDLSQYRSRILGSANAGKSLMIAGASSYVIGLLALLASVLPLGAVATLSWGVVIFTFGLICYAASQRVARKLSENKREALKKAQATTA